MTELAISIAVNILLGAVAVLLVYIYRARLTDDARLANSASAVDMFRVQFPELAGMATLTSDRRGALIELQNDPSIGFLQRHGQRWIARTLSAGELKSAQLLTEGSIRLQFADYGWPQALLRIDDPDARARWLERLQGLVTRADVPTGSGAGRA